MAVQEGCDEMVVDVYRMINAKGKSKEDPMARFNKMDDPKDGFKARWDLPQVCVVCMCVCICVCVSVYVSE